MTTCIICSCTDDNACDGGCSWIALSPGELAGLCSACGLGAIGAVTIDEANDECEQVEREWIADQPAIRAEYEAAERLILPGDPAFDQTLRARR